MATLACHRYSISWRNVGIPLNRHVHFKFWRFNFSLYNVIGWKKQHSCSHALYLENTSLRCTSLSNNMYGWNIQYVQRESFLLPLVRHHSYKNEQYAIQSNCAEHATNLSNMCLYFYIFTKVQYTIHCRKQGCLQDAWSSQKKLVQDTAVFRKLHFSSFSCAFMHKVSVYFFPTRQRFSGKI